MSFQEILDQVLAILQRRRRMSHRTLRRHSALNEATLEDLKSELAYAHPQLSDHGDRGFERTSDTALLEGHSPPISPYKPVPDASVTPLVEAERRQLTVLFCDVVDSTTLSQQLDPEDLREVIRAYQATCGDVIQRFEGSIAQFLGDGLLVYFSYPQAHEDDPQRAVHTALEIIQALGALNVRLAQDYRVHLSVRIGIHTGLVVVGEMGTGERREHLALGETPNVAARLQGLAAPNTVVISAITYHLVQREFDIDALGLYALKGSSSQVQLYRVVRARGGTCRLGASQFKGLTPLAGREGEVELLLERWAQARDGAGQVVVLSGEAGIGKSRLIETLKASVVHEPHLLFECWSSPHYQGTALYPIAESFQRTLQWQPDDTPEERLRKLERTIIAYHLPLDDLVPLLTEFLSIQLPHGRYPPLALSPRVRRRKVLEALLTILLAQAADQPVLFILEDLHWLDPWTLEFLSLLIDRVPGARLCVILTCRADFQVPWREHASLTELTLHRLSPVHAERIIAWVTGGKSLPAEVRSVLREKTDGIPLFIEEMTRAILESGVLEETSHHYVMASPLTSFAIPTTLHDSLMARLDRLGPAKEIAQVGAVLGRQFSRQLLQAVMPYDEHTLQQKIAPLIEGGLLYQQRTPSQVGYIFKHALIQEAAYQSLLKSVRQRHHQHVAQILESLYSDNLEPYLIDLAHHLVSAGPAADPRQVLYYSRRAGDRARALFAWREAAHYHTAALSAGETAKCLGLQQRAELHYLAGFASYEDGNMGRCLDHYDRAIELYRLANDLHGLTQVLIKKIYLTIVSSYGGPVDVRPLEEVLETLEHEDRKLCAHLLISMSEVYWTARQPNKAQAVAQRALAIGIRLADDEICSRASFDVAMAQSQSLRLREALRSYERTRQYAQHARNLWLEGWPLQRMPIALFQLGRFEEAAQVAQEAREFASKTNNWGHYSLTTGTLTCMAVAKGDFSAAERYARETVDLLSQYHFPYGGALALPALACAHMLQGAVLEAQRVLDMLMEPGRVFENPEPSFGPMIQVYRQLIHLDVDIKANTANPAVTHLLSMLGTESFDVTSLAPYCALIELSAFGKASDSIGHLYTQVSSATEEGILFSRGWIFFLPRVLGVAATVGQQWQTAERHFEQAMEIATRLGAGPELGLSYLGYAKMLAKRGSQGDPAHAIDLLHKGSDILKEFRMTSLARYTDVS